MNKILIAAYNKTFRQSSDPVYAHTPMRNVGELRTFNPKLKDSAGGEVNENPKPHMTRDIVVVRVHTRSFTNIDSASADVLMSTDDWLTVSSQYGIHTVNKRLIL